MGALNIPSATAKQEQAKAIGEAIRLLHRAGWHEYAKQIANDAQESGICVDDGKQLVRSESHNNDQETCGRCGHTAVWHANVGRGECRVHTGCDCYEFCKSAPAVEGGRTITIAKEK